MNEIEKLKRYIKHLGGLIKILLEDNEQLEQENEQLNIALKKSEQVKKLVAFDKNGNAYFVDENNKYIKTLEEINLILDELKQQYDYMSDYSEIKEIQDKINEVLDERN